MQVISDLRALWPLTGFRRLFAVRLVSQASDGMFQIGLATLFFFSPENASTATGVAAAFAVLLLPFTIVGPWAGVLLDRWRRRQVLLYGNLVRVVLTLVIAAIMLTSGVGPAVYVLALVTLSVNRFLLAALSASLPKVVDGPLLLTANSLTPTLGAGAAGVGGAVGFALGLLLPTGRAQDAISLVVAAAVMACASGLATRLAPDQLGPDERTPTSHVRRALGDLARGLVAGGRYLVARRTPAYALGIMALHRFCYGAVFIASILISRNLLSDPTDVEAGLATFGTVLAASAVGFALAVVLTPVLSPRVGPHVWVVLCLLLAVVSQLVLVVTVSLPAVLAAGGALGLAAQGAKIAVDTIVQRDTADAYRGRAFSLYDVMYNAAFVGAAALAAVALPDTGWSPPLFAVLAGVYLAGAVVFARSPRTPASVDVPPVEVRA
ncbi:MFS transporter [Cellulomonas dongxiuzhuiae]|uniref:MFS transporter n=1 Tax=Cellulomonas dongxiuzhuiae TaxID=2819979 RepID=A0ABX8GKP2_9CELL|nr:MFS transporter [Cellulomonas dongxiuzhuiae]MBO3095089.1 MFS transporter [Cellulomonas dongxiuzhuiae]QWC16101.1 MFS transporter [Cellulomonas dongxiuzhuiae]